MIMLSQDSSLDFIASVAGCAQHLLPYERAIVLGEQVVALDTKRGISHGEKRCFHRKNSQGNAPIATVADAI